MDKITVCQPNELSLSTGDRLQLKANAQSQDGRRLANGELVTVKQIHADGHIALNDGRVLPNNYRQFVRGYAVTSYAAQGKTVDYVLFSDSAVKAATNEQQGQDTLTLSFLKRTVFIKGKNLRELGLALQDRHIEFIKPMPVYDRYSSLAISEGAVKTIEITDNKDQG